MEQPITVKQAGRWLAWKNIEPTFCLSTNWCQWHAHAQMGESLAQYVRSDKWKWPTVFCLEINYFCRASRRVAMPARPLLQSFEAAWCFHAVPKTHRSCPCIFGRPCSRCVCVCLCTRFQFTWLSCSEQQKYPYRSIAQLRISVFVFFPFVCLWVFWSFPLCVHAMQWCHTVRLTSHPLCSNLNDIVCPAGGVSYS